MWGMKIIKIKICDCEIYLRAWEECKYLGSTISNKATANREIVNRISQCQMCIGALSFLLSSKQIRINTETRIYRAIIELVLTYRPAC